MPVHKPSEARMPSRILRIGGSLAWHLFPAGIFFAWTFLYYPYREVFAMDLDEGINLMKALLVSRGFQLYSQIWSDQPPIFTYLLAGFFELVGYQVNHGRLLSLIFSTLLVWAAMQYLRLVWGRVAALAGLALLILLPGYLSFSVSVLIGLPSLALAVVSMLALALWHRRREVVWLWLSGSLFSLSIFTKLITAFVIPIFIIGLIAGEWDRWRRTGRALEIFRPALLWATGLGLSSLLLVGLLVGRDGIVQLVVPHLQTIQLEAFQVSDSTLTIQYHLRPAWPVLLLAVFGGISLIRHRRWLGLYPLAWAGLAYLILTQYAPIWAHQQLLVSVPAVLVAAGGLGDALVDLPETVRYLKTRRGKALLSAAMVVVTGLVLVIQGPLIAGQWQKWASSAQKPTSTETTVLRKLDKFAPQTRWLVTDRPMYAFRAGLLVPPELAVFSSKRVETGYLTGDEMQAAIEHYQPEQILIGRFDFPEMDQELQTHYRLTFDRTEIQLYVRNDLN